MDMQKLSKRTTALLPEIIEAVGINVPIYRVEEPKTLIRFYLCGRTRPLVVRKHKRRTKQRATTKRPPAK